MMRRLWLGFAAVILVSFAVLGWTGFRIYQDAPPIPQRVVTTAGQVVMSGSDISAGQNVWQSMGGMESGSIWGHGSYVAPDWTADWLHRELVFILDEWSRARHGRPYAQLGSEQQGGLQRRLEAMIRPNRYDLDTGVLTIDPVRARAYAANAALYADIFSRGRARAP